jgi:hypothetical protein
MLTIPAGKKPWPSEHGTRPHGLFIQVASQAGFSFLIDQGSYFGFI